jgi:hypothetical protein
MGTRSIVGIQEKDNTITNIYVHWDGYPDGVGAVLLAHYASEERIRALMASGSHSTLGADPQEGAYGGEDDEAIRTRTWPDAGQEYVYLYRSGEWHVAACDWQTGKPGELKRLKQLVSK